MRSYSRDKNVLLKKYATKDAVLEISALFSVVLKMWS